MIVVADKKNVYNPKKYPIPLVNRLEKHLLSIDSILNPKMKDIVKKINKWLEGITEISEKYAYSNRATVAAAKSTNNTSSSKLKPVDIFVGLTEDTVSSLVYKFSKENNYEAILNNENYIYDEESKNCEQSLIDSVKEYLLQSCTSDGIIRLLNNNFIAAKSESININSIIDIYFNQQTHENFGSFFQKHCLNRGGDADKNQSMSSNFVQITTHSRLLSRVDVDLLQSILNKDQKFKYKIESLLSFDTQQQFIQVLKEFYEANAEKGSDKNVLIIQCDCAHFYQDLINCARFTIIDEFSKYTLLNTNFSIVLVVQIPKIAGGCISGFQTTKWLCYHIDDLQNNFYIDNILNFKDKSLSEIFTDSSSFEAEPELNVKNYMFLISLLKSVVFNSCSKIIDTSSDSNSFGKNRSIERIDILLKILNSKSVSDLNSTEFNLAKSFCIVLMKYLARLQAERESFFSTPTRSKNWIFNEVSKISSVIKYGTLKNSCINYIETRLSSLFSGKYPTNK